MKAIKVAIALSAIAGRGWSGYLARMATLPEVKFRSACLPLPVVTCLAPSLPKE
jgi:hypothetical protein